MLRHLFRSRKATESLNSSLPVRLLGAQYSTKKGKVDDDLPTWELDKYEESTDPMKDTSIREFPNMTPLQRVVNMFKRDWVLTQRRAKSLITGVSAPYDPDDYSYHSENWFPRECEVVIVGGGAIGSSIAYWIQQRIPRDFKVVVVDKDPTYKTASTPLSVGGIRQQFSFEDNIEMSLFGSDFLRNINKFLAIDGEPPVDIRFHPYGYLFLATEKGAEAMIENHKLQISLGARNICLTPGQLKERFPWIKTDGIALGCLGQQKEGWFDPWLLLNAYKKKAMSLGVEYITGEAKGFVFTRNSNAIDEDSGRSMHERPERLVVETKDGKCRSLKFAMVVIASGAFSSRIARMARIGNGDGVLSIRLPVEPRKRYVYCFHAPDGPGLNTPMTVHPNGTYFRREGLGGLYICGKQPTPEEEPATDNLDVDEDFFHQQIRPDLSNLVPSFEQLKLKSSWAGYYDYNTFDENGIIGCHPYYRNVVFATGFTDHGVQHSPAIGRAVMELLVHSKFMSIDLGRLSFDRFIDLERMSECTTV